MVQELHTLGSEIVAETVERSSALRWIRRRGEPVLQQCWIIFQTNRNGYIDAAKEEWRDVPTEDE
jgi:hypothetical protein